MRITRRLAPPGGAARFSGPKPDSAHRRIVSMLINTLLWALGAIVFALGLTCSSDEERSNWDPHSRH